MNKKMAQDWPYLEKYSKENAKLVPPKKDENRVVFMGDSITEFWSLVCPEFFEGKPYINRGISGQTTPQMLIRFRSDVINLQPNLVVILAGANDIAGNTGPSTLEMITNNIFSMIELAQAHQIQVIVCSVLPAFDFPWKTGCLPAKKIMQLNAILQEYANKNAILYVNYHYEMADDRNGMKTELADDGVHPNKNGYKVMGIIIEKAIKQIVSPQ
jgi:lysophospholipase L1-like esterase